MGRVASEARDYTIKAAQSVAFEKTDAAKVSFLLALKSVLRVKKQLCRASQLPCVLMGRVVSLQVTSDIKVTLKNVSASHVVLVSR